MWVVGYDLATFVDNWIGNIWTNNYSLSYFTDQIDIIRRLGGNCISLFGNTSWQGTGDITMSQYLQRREAVVDYAHSVGVYVLAYGMAYDRDEAPATEAQKVDAITEDAALLSTKANVIGYVCMDEPRLQAFENANIWRGNATEATILGYLESYYEAVKAVVPADFAVATSDNPCGDSIDPAVLFDVTSNTWWDAVKDWCDFLAFNTFFDVEPSDYAAVRVAEPGKDIIFSSSGLSQAESAANQALVMRAYQRCVNTDRVRGVLKWCTKRYATAAPDDWGHFNDDNTQRPTVTIPFIESIAGPFWSSWQ